MLMFSISGIILNHRSTFSNYNVSRSWLPDDYRYDKWNNGLLRGTVPYSVNDSVKKVVLYGASGIWITDSAASSFKDFNAGLPDNADGRHIKGCTVTPDNGLWAASQFALYRYDNKNDRWNEIALPFGNDEKLSDITVHGDTLMVVGRSHLFVSHAPYNDFKLLQIKAPEGYSGKVSLFKTVWNAHNGEIFGIGGRLFVDCIAIVIIILCITGIVYWLMPKYIRRRKKAGSSVKTSAKILKTNLNWHDKAGRYTFGILLFVVVTGWCLRPPMLIALASHEVPAIPFSTMDDDNAWGDKLRMLRYDDACGDWLLSTSEGFYSFKSLDGTPTKLAKTPPVSVMGLNAWQKDRHGNWLTGSFSGMFRWNRQACQVKDYFTGEITKSTHGSPIGSFAVSGFSDDFEQGTAIVEYAKGTDQISMPDEFEYLPMSLWNFAHEIHSGRIYTILGPVNVFFIFFAGIFAIWCLVSGYVIRMKKKKH